MITIKEKTKFWWWLNWDSVLLTTTGLAIIAASIKYLFS